MIYSKEYLDKYFSNVNEYSSIVELINIALSRFELCDIKEKEWIIVVSEILNWQAMSDRSGVWTYYEVLNDKHVEIILDFIMKNGKDTVLDKYIIGVGKYEDDNIMDEIDYWIRNNEEIIYGFIVSILLNRKVWFYNN